MKNLYLQLVLFVVGLTCQAQTISQDSLRREFLRIRSNHYETFFNSFDSEIARYPYKAALSAIYLLYDIGRKNDDCKTIYYTLRSASRFYKFHKNYVLADSLLQANLIHVQTCKLQSEQPQVLLDLGYLYKDLYKYPEAIRYMEQAYELFLQQGYRVRAALVEYEMGTTCYKANETNCSEYFNRALALGGDSLGTVYKISSYNTLGLQENRKFQYTQALFYYRKALQVATSEKDSAWIGLMQGHIGQVLAVMQKNEEALPYLLAGLKSNIHYREFSSAASASDFIAKVYHNKNDKKNALKYLLMGAELAKRSNNVYGLRIVYRDLSLIYEKDNQPELALKYLRWYVKASDSIARQNREIAIIKAQSAFDLQKKQHQVKTLIDSNRRREQIALAVFIAFGLFVLSVLLTLRIYQKIKINQLLVSQKVELQKKNIQLEAQQKEIESQNEELLQSQEEIAAQRDLLSLQNQQLQQVQQIITRQNEEIQLKNQGLEEQVKARTYKLVEYNRQLEEFAFITAHNLRTPVARILGLGQVLHLPDIEPDEEKLFIEKLVSTTLELDQVLKEMNAVLEKKQGERPEDSN